MSGGQQPVAPKSDNILQRLERVGTLIERAVEGDMKPPASAINLLTASVSMLPSFLNAPTTTPFTPSSRHILTDPIMASISVSS